MKRLLFLLPALFLLSACSKNLQLVEFKSGAKAEGFWDSGKRELRIYLEDGEILTGKFIKMSHARFRVTTGVGFGGRHTRAGVYPSIGIDGQGNIYALLENPESHLVMEVVADYNWLGGGGHGEARTNDGRIYKIVF